MGLTRIGKFVVIVVAVVAFFGPGVLTGREVFFTLDGPGSDFWHLNYPFRAYYAERLAEGELPLWCDRMGTGFPLLADGQVSGLYPPNLLLYSLLPLPAALNAEILLHLILAGIFASMFARRRGANLRGGLLAGLAYALSGFLLVHLKHTNMLTAAAWLPLLLLLLERFLDARRAGTFALLALAVGLSALGGHPQIAYLNLLVAGLYGLCLLPGRPLGEAARTAGGWLLAVVLGLALAAPQLLPTLELAHAGAREGGLPLAEVNRHRYAPRHLLLFVAPHALGDPAVVREAIDPDGTVRYQAFDPAVEDPAIFWECTSYVGLLPLALALLALALTRRRALPLALAGAFSLLLAFGPRGGLFLVLREVVPGFDLFRFPSRALLHVTLALAVLGGVGLTELERVVPSRYRRLAWLALPLCFLDLFLAFGDHNRRVPADRWFTPPESVRTIEEAERGRTDPFRIAVLDPERRTFHEAYARAGGWKGDLAPYESAWNMLHPNLNLLFGLTSLDVHSPSAIRWARKGITPVYWAEDPRPEAREAARRIASLLNVRYLLSPREGVLPNPAARPRAFLVSRARHSPPGEELRALIDPRFDPEIELLVPREVPDDGPASPVGGVVTWRRRSPHHLRLTVTAPRDAWLFLSDTYYPGWEARVDRRPVPILRANVLGRGVRVPGGRHEVAFDYRPASLRWGLRIAAAGGAVLLVVLLGGFLRRRRRSEYPRPGPTSGRRKERESRC